MATSLSVVKSNCKADLSLSLDQWLVACWGAEKVTTCICPSALEWLKLHHGNIEHIAHTYWWPTAIGYNVHTCESLADNPCVNIGLLDHNTLMFVSHQVMQAGFTAIAVSAPHNKHSTPLYFAGGGRKPWITQAPASSLTSLGHCFWCSK
jgi:hypothetical protein